jgi:hypothetical protein
VSRDLDIIGRHINAVIHDLYMREVVHQISRILGDRRFRDAMLRNGRAAGLQELKKWLRDVADGEVSAGDFMGIARHLRSMLTFSAMAYSATSAIVQPTGLIQGLGVKGFKRAEIARGLAMAMKVAAEQAQSVVTGKRGALLDAVYKESPLMEIRSQSANADIRAARDMGRPGRTILTINGVQVARPQGLVQAMLSPLQLLGQQRGDRPRGRELGRRGCIAGACGGVAHATRHDVRRLALVLRKVS